MNSSSAIASADSGVAVAGVLGLFDRRFEDGDRPIEVAFDAVRDLPYRKDAFSGTELDYRSPGVSKGFYDYFVSTPGHLVPRTRLSGEVIEGLPGWLKSLYGEQTVWQWITLLLSLALTALAASVLTRRIRRLAKQVGRPKGGFVRILSPISIAILVTAVLAFLDDQVNITGGLLTALAIGGKAIVLAMAVWAVFGLCKAVAEAVIASPRTRIKDESIDATMWRIGSRILGFLLSLLILIRGMQLLGADLVPLLAGSLLPREASADNGFVDLWLTPDQQGRRLLERGDYREAAQDVNSGLGKVLRMTSFEGQLHQAMFEAPVPGTKAGDIIQV